MVVFGELKYVMIIDNDDDGKWLLYALYIYKYTLFNFIAKKKKY